MLLFSSLLKINNADLVLSFVLIMSCFWDHEPKKVQISQTNVEPKWCETVGLCSCWRENEVEEVKEEGPKEMTLDEWKAMQDKERAKVEFNIRKANEGATWKSGFLLHKSKAEVSQTCMWFPRMDLCFTFSLWWVTDYGYDICYDTPQFIGVCSVRLPLNTSYATKQHPPIHLFTQMHIPALYCMIFLCNEKYLDFF